VPVHVEHRHEQQHQLVQCPGRGLPIQHLPQCEEAGILALDFAGMDAACTRTTGSLRTCAVAGSKTPLRVATRTSCGRPSGVVPKFRQRTASGYAAANATHKRSTSS
jgi:hypothetical protein